MNNGLRLLFLDIDGVLNCHEDVFHNGIHTIDPVKVARLNRIIESTNAQIVISSAWRYMILRDAMTTLGFRYMLNTYGLDLSVRVHGCTQSDEQIPGRGDQILAYASAYETQSFVVLDDGSDDRHDEASTLSESLMSLRERWVKVAACAGLTDADADLAVALLLR